METQTPLPTLSPEELITARERMGLSLSEAARQLQTTPQKLWNWEHGVADPPSKILIAMCLLYKVRIEHLASA